MGIGKKYRERRVQLNRPVQCGGKSNITEKNRNIASMCEHLRGFSMLESCSPRYVPGVVGASRTEKEEHPGKPQNPTGSPMGKHQSDRMQVIGGKLLIGQLAPWVTWDI